MSTEGEKIRARGLDFNVVVEGEGPEVLLIHGFPDSNAVWRHQIPALVAAGYRVIAPDLRGFGASSAPPKVSDYKIDRFVDDLVGILDALEVSTVHLVGHDWGAAVGWQKYVTSSWRYERVAGGTHWLQLEAPERVNSLLLDFLR